MTSRTADSQWVRDQYATSANLDARIALHVRYSTAKQSFHDWLFDRVGLPASAHILEVGCGSGALWQTVAARRPSTWRLTLTDLSFGMLETARATTPSAQFHFSNADAQALPFSDASLDAVFANHMLYHVPDLDRALAEIRRVLKPGCKLYAATNGVKHLQELRAFISKFNGGFPPLNDRAFTLENGIESLSRHFSNITRADQPNNLSVTDAEPLVAYILSGAPFDLGPVSPTRVADLRARIQSVIDQHGAFYITKSVGVFTASS